MKLDVAPFEGRSLWVAGFDLSTTTIHAAAIPLRGAVPHPLVLVAEEVGGNPNAPGVRTVLAGKAARRAMQILDDKVRLEGGTVVIAAVERPGGGGPIGRNVAESLLPILGSVSMALHDYDPDWHAPAAWRKLVGTYAYETNSKAGGHAAVLRAIPHAEGLGPDELDALGLAIAQRRLAGDPTIPREDHQS